MMAFALWEDALVAEPRTGLQVGLYALVHTPPGTFHVSPSAPDQDLEIAGLTVLLWDGRLKVRRDDSNGPRAGRMYAGFGLTQIYRSDPW